MLKAGITVIRIGEFAWSKIELTEGSFDFSFFDEFLDLCEKTGMKVIMETPTATPRHGLPGNIRRCSTRM